MTYSLAVVMLETTQSIDLFIPTIFSVVVARATGNFLTPSLYDVALDTKGIPLLKDMAPSENRFVRAQEIMTRDVMTLEIVSPVSRINSALCTNHQAFPLLNKAGNVVGIIPRRFLKILIKKDQFTENSNMYHDLVGITKS